MNFEESFKKVLTSGYDIEKVCNSDNLYEVDVNGKTRILTEDEVICFAETI